MNLFLLEFDVHHKKFDIHHKLKQTQPLDVLIFLKKEQYIDWRENCKKTTKHHAYLSLCANSRKANDANSRKWPKTSILANV